MTPAVPEVCPYLLFYGERPPLVPPMDLEDEELNAAYNRARLQGGSEYDNYVRLKREREEWSHEGSAGLEDGADSVGEVSEETIREALAGDKTKTLQKEVSLPMVKRYVDKLRKGEKPPAIKMDGDIIVDGNHRYTAGKIHGEMPPTRPSIAPKNIDPKNIEDIGVSPQDWGGH